MYLDYEVKIPDSRHGITRKTIRGITYIYYVYDRKYSSDKHYNTVNDCFADGGVTVTSNTAVPAFRLKLCTEDNRTLYTAGFNDFKELPCLLG